MAFFIELSFFLFFIPFPSPIFVIRLYLYPFSFYKPYPYFLPSHSWQELTLTSPLVLAGQ